MPVTLDDIVTLIAMKGPMGSAAILAAYPSVKRRSLGSKLVRLRHPENKRIYISEWTRAPSVGTKTNLRPLYSVGDHSDMPSPPAYTTKERGQRRQMLIEIKRAAKLNAPLPLPSPPPPPPLPPPPPPLPPGGTSLAPQDVTARVANSAWAFGSKG